MTLPRKRVAVIGAGVSGLGAAYLLKDAADVVVYEREPRIGGHAHTVEIDYLGTPVAVDIGFIVYNELNYPNLTGMLDSLGVKTIASDMSFAVSDPDGFEWSSDLAGLFAWKRNLANREFIGLLLEILRFNKVGRRPEERAKAVEMSLGVFLDRHGFSEAFRRNYLLPMGAAIWSTPEGEMLSYPAESLLQFFENHRLMHAHRPIWRTVAGGSRNYVNKLAAELGDRIRVGSGAQRVSRGPDGGLTVTDMQGGTQAFDAAVLASHADQSRHILATEFEAQRMPLGSIRFSPNTAYLHRDPSLMPRRRAAWASWNVLKGADDRVCITYWMNRLQKLPSDKPLFVTLNPARPPAESLTFGSWAFDHPMYDAASGAARREITRLQGDDGLYLAGAWIGDGFHEAGLRSGVEAAYAIGGRAPWAAVLRNEFKPAADAPALRLAASSS
ncbi:NAD(P)-binding protein [bacterium]|nr:NAD(P)-binding protein [bacterium]